MCILIILLLLYFSADEVDNSQLIYKVNLQPIQADLSTWHSLSRWGLHSNFKRWNKVAEEHNKVRLQFNLNHNSMHFCDYISDALHERSLIIRLVNSWLIAASAAPLHTKLSHANLGGVRTSFNNNNNNNNSSSSRINDHSGGGVDPRILPDSDRLRHRQLHRHLDCLRWGTF